MYLIVEVHSPEWWIQKYESWGFKYSPELTEEAKKIAKDTKKSYKGPNGEYLDGFYVRVTLKVFINPVVAALPEHAHLFPDPGCLSLNGEKKRERVKRKCTDEGDESPLDPEMEPLTITDEMDEKWLNHIKENFETAYKK